MPGPPTFDDSDVASIADSQQRFLSQRRGLGTYRLRIDRRVCDSDTLILGCTLLRTGDLLGDHFILSWLLPPSWRSHKPVSPLYIRFWTTTPLRHAWHQPCRSFSSIATLWRCPSRLTVTVRSGPRLLAIEVVADCLGCCAFPPLYSSSRARTPSIPNTRGRDARW